MPRPRFSLLSLLLFVVLTASLVSIFKNFDAWRTKPIGSKEMDNFHFSHCGDYVLARSDSAICIWNAHSGELLKSIFANEPEVIRYATMEPNNEEILIGYDGPKSKTVRMNWRTEDVLHTFEDALLFPRRPDILHSQDDGDYRHFFIHRPSPTKRIPIPFLPKRLLMAPDQSFVLCSGREQNVFVINWPDGSLRFQLCFDNPGYSPVALSQDGQRAVMVLSDSLLVFDTQTGSHLSSIPIDYDLNAWVTFLTADRILVASPTHNAIHVWDIQCGQLITEVPTHPGLQTAKLINGGRLLATFSFTDTPRRPLPRCQIWSMPSLSLHSAHRYVCDIEETSRGTFLEEEDFGLRELNGKCPDAPLSYQIDLINKKGDAALCYPDAKAWEEAASPRLLLSRQRPEPWWGLAWLPEFWTTLVLGILFLRNIFRRT